jgi:hypothetical protein
LTALTVMSLIAYERLRRTDQEPEATSRGTYRGR